MSGWHDWNLGFNSHKQFNPMEKEKLRRGMEPCRFSTYRGNGAESLTVKRVLGIWRCAHRNQEP
jgi:hypothetical protein